MIDVVYKLEALNKLIDSMGKVNDYTKELNNNFTRLKKILDENVKINDVTAFKEYQDSVSNDIKSISSNVTNVIVPSLHETIKTIGKS